MAEAFPRLTESSHRSTSPADVRYNCIAWAAMEVALYGFGFFYTHAVRQLANGKWTSKLGKAEDIEHDSPDDIAGGLYGEVVQFMRRVRPDMGDR